MECPGGSSLLSTANQHHYIFFTCAKHLLLAQIRSLETGRRILRGTFKWVALFISRGKHLPSTDQNCNFEFWKPHSSINVRSFSSHCGSQALWWWSLSTLILNVLLAVVQNIRWHLGLTRGQDSKKMLIPLFEGHKRWLLMLSVVFLDIGLHISLFHIQPERKGDLHRRN